MPGRWGRAGLLGHLPHDRAPDRRGRRSGLRRLLDLLSLFLGLSELPYRPVRNRDHEDYCRDNGAQNACY